MATDYIVYKRSRFSTRLPTDRVYAASHFWILRQDQEVCRIGFTKFAVRFLGEPVEFDVEVGRDERVETGQVIGWLEGFKAVTDLYCPMSGVFAGVNPALAERIENVRTHPYEGGWLYEVCGSAGADCMSAEKYVELLNRTIDTMTGRGA